MRNVLALIFWVGICELVGLLSSRLSILPALPVWYEKIIKPWYNPPGWVFAPVWIFLYFLMGIAAFLVWKAGWKKKRVQIALGFFVSQLILNFLWGVLFFGLRSPLAGLVGIIWLWVFIILTMWQFKKISAAAFWLFVPYLVWVTYAALINIGVVILN